MNAWASSGLGYSRRCGSGGGRGGSLGVSKRAGRQHVAACAVAAPAADEHSDHVYW